MSNYYSDQLAAERLERCYELAPPRVRQYLNAEIEHVAGRIRPSDTILELGCGYGRVLAQLAERCGWAVGIDTSAASLALASRRLRLRPRANCWLLRMDALTLGFRDAVFDVVLCIQNGISAFQVDQRALIAEALRVTCPGGRVLLSSYAARFWQARLEWFRLQAAAGLLGAIDEGASGAGVIVCKDGFRATTVDPARFEALIAGLGRHRLIHEVDESSVFCELIA
ncbi:MAG: class I SAM-dependent methyltransferase [Planctomycetes bacterium]|nr:class I SAM-dependent methyltransferase [Planctomycetota bacterium]